MGSFANSLFKIMLGWVQGAASAVWSAFTNENGSSFFSWIGQHWILLAVILCLIGLSADLCVYIFRWKPFKVWKSFLTRNRDHTDRNGAAEEQELHVREREPVRRMRSAGTETDTEPRTEYRQEPDLTQWDPEPEQPDPEETVQNGAPDTVTNAGYVVPADSPYRRPAEQIKTAGPEEQETERSDPDGPEQAGAVPLRSGKRRRIRMTELFTDPEEELRQFDAPQHIIDSRKAYHDPVYPRGWKKSEEDEE